MPKAGRDLLTDVGIRNTKPKSKTTMLRDGGGLWLIVEPSGKKWWKLRIVFAKKENSFSLGEYPSVTLAGARDERDNVRRQVAAGIDPAVTRKSEKAAQTGEGTFEVVARDWYKRNFDNSKWTPGHAKDIIARLVNDVFPIIGQRPINEITAPEMLALLRRIEARTLETAHKVKATCGQIFRYAIASGVATNNPADVLKGVLPPVKPKHMAAPTEPKEVAPLLRMTSNYSGSLIVASALRLAPLVFVRPGELRQAEWSAINFETAEWRYTVTKTNTSHIVPLSRQAIAILLEIQKLTGSGRYVFPSARSASRPMSDAAINAAMRRMGIDTRSELTGHGFRAMARTILDEVLGFKPELIEHQLAHSVRDPLGRAYNRTKHLPERKVMLQAWADYLDQLVSGAEIIPLRESAG